MADFLVAKANQTDSTMIYDVRKSCPSLVHTHDAGLHPGMVSCKEESFSDLPHLPFQFHGAVMRCPGDPPGSTDLPPAPVFTALVIREKQFDCSSLSMQFVSVCNANKLHRLRPDLECQDLGAICRTLSRPLESGLVQQNSRKDQFWKTSAFSIINQNAT